MRLEDRIKLRWVRGNDVTLRVTLTEPECDSNGVPVKNGSKQSWKAVDLDAYEQIGAKLKRMFTGFTAMDTMCGQVEEPCCYPVESGKGDGDGVLIVEAPGTLPVGIYALEVTGMRDGRSMRSFETMLFGIVECNGKANATFDVIDGQKSADVDIKVQLVSSATVRGKNAYELWKEIPGNENKTLQEYLDVIVSGEAEQADWNATNTSSPAYIKNKPEVYTKAEVQALVNGVSKFRPVLADALPVASEDTMEKLYLIPSTNPVQGNTKDEFVTIAAVSNGVTTYTWEMIGSKPVDISGKQDVINDLDAIRSGAAAGATAYQKPGAGIPSTDMTAAVQTSLAKADNAITQHQDISGKADKTAVDAALATKADKATTYTKADVDSIVENMVYLSDDDGQASTADFDPQADTVWNIPQTLGSSQQAQARANIGVVDVSGTNDGTNWTSITIGSTTKAIPSGGSSGDVNVIETVKVNGTALTPDANKAVDVKTHDAVTNHGTSDTTFALTPNVLHIWGTVTSLTLTLATPTDSTIVNEYMFQFTSGSTATTLSLPSSVTWVAAPSINAGVTYQVSIINNLGVIAEFSETV